MSILNAWIRKHKTLPLLRETLEAVIRSRRNEMVMVISDSDWELLRQVRQSKKVSGIDGYEKLINSRLVFEYRQNQESWFDINPLLAEAKEMQD